MTPIIVCLLCLAAVALWAVYSTMCGIRALGGALAEEVIYIIYALLAFGVAYLCMNTLIILFTDFSYFWELIKELFESLGGFWGIVGLIVGIVIVGGILGYVGTFLLGLLMIVGEILIYAVLFVLGAFLAIFEFIENKSKQGYEVVVTKIANRIMNKGGSQ